MVREQVRLALAEAIAVDEDGDAVVDEASVAAGGQLTFHATPIAEPGRDVVEWLVNDLPGGDDSVGTIDSNGVFTAPLAPPSGGRVTVGARLLGIGGTLDTLDVVVLVPESLTGSGLASPSSATTVYAQICGRRSIFQSERWRPRRA